MTWLVDENDEVDFIEVVTPSPEKKKRTTAPRTTRFKRMEKGTSVAVDIKRPGVKPVELMEEDFDDAGDGPEFMDPDDL